MANVQALRVPQADPRDEIRGAIDGFMQAFEAKDLNGILACYAPDVVVYDMMPPLRRSGMQEWRGVWEKSLNMMKGDIQTELRDLHIDVNGDLAVCHALNHFVMTGGEQADIWFRWTATFRKISGKWLVTHEHTSVPGDVESGKAILDLKPA